MNKKILDLVLMEFQTKRNIAELKREQNLEKARQYDEYKQIEREINQLIFNIGKLKFEQKDIKKEEQKLKELEAKKQEFLIDKGINPNSLKPNYDCKLCNDTGFYNGKLCKCLKQAYNNKIMQSSNIELDKFPSLTDYNAECFDDEEKLNIKKVVSNLLNFANNLETSATKNVMLVGGTGVGKTYVAKCLGKQVLQNGNTVLFISAFNLNNTFLKVHTSSEINKISLLQNLIDVDLLIIDDLGTEPLLKNVTREYLLLLLNERINANKSTVITTNLMPNNILDVYLERVYSRLFNKQNCALLYLKGKDLRVK